MLASSPTLTPTLSLDFKLSFKEQEVYNNFQKDLNEQYLKELEPISIAKLYVQASLDYNNDVVYALYTDKKGHIQWTKEEDEKIPNSDRGIKEQILKTFNKIENGKFVQTSDFEGYIEYLSSEDTESKYGFKMIKDDDGIWNVSFQPIQ
nr:RNA polymerase subunit sigma [Paenibacillus sp. PL91]